MKTFILAAIPFFLGFNGSVNIKTRHAMHGITSSATVKSRLPEAQINVMLRKGSGVGHHYEIMVHQFTWNKGLKEPGAFDFQYSANVKSDKEVSGLQITALDNKDNKVEESVGGSHKFFLKVSFGMPPDVKSYVIDTRDYSYDKAKENGGTDIRINGPYAYLGANGKTTDSLSVRVNIVIDNNGN